MGRNDLLIGLAVSFFMAHGSVGAQDHRFMVFFQDKDQTYSVENPGEFLSQRAIDRRQRQNLTITEQDLPVNQSYINAVSEMGIQVWYATKWMNGVLIQTDSSTLDMIQAQPFVTSIELVAPGPLVPGNKSFVKNKGLKWARSQSTDVQNELMGIDLMHNDGNRGEGVLIAVFDGGFEGVNSTAPFAHILDESRLLQTFDFVGNSTDVFRYDDHGTKSLSVIGGNIPGSFTGTAAAASFLLCVTEDVSSEYRIEEYNWLFAAELADSAGVDVINTSLGYNTFDDSRMNYTTADLDGQTAVISRAASIAASKGMVLTMSAGNSGSSAWGLVTAPADALNVLSIGAISSDSSKATFSSVGPTADGRTKPDVVALGVGTAVINNTGELVFNNGTSFSAPQVAGLVAGFWQENPDFDYLQVISAIRNSGHAMAPNNELGYGIPHYGRAVDLVLAIEDPVLEGLVKLYPNPIENNLFLIADLPVDQATLTLYNLSGQKIMEDQLYNIPAAIEVPITLPMLQRGVFIITLYSDRQLASYRLIKY